MQYYHWNLHDIEEMFPFERAIYIALINNYQREQEEKQRNRKH